MKRAKNNKDVLLSEYDFSKGVRGKYASRFASDSDRSKVRRRSERKSITKSGKPRTVKHVIYKDNMGIIMRRAHDNEVREIAKEYKKKGWKVKAHLKEFETPSKIGKNKHIPDLVVTRGSKTKIIEVDTPNTIDEDQLKTFRRSAAHRKNTEFKHIKTK